MNLACQPINMHMQILIEQCAHGHYSLVVDSKLLIRTRCKRTVDHYYAQACEHYTSSSEPYVCRIAEPYARASSSSNT